MLVCVLIGTLETPMRQRPPLLALLFLFLVAPVWGKSTWVLARSEHFDMFSSGRQSYTESLVQDLEDTYEVFRQIYAYKPKYPVRMLVFFCARDSDLKPFQRIFKGKRVEIGGYYLGPSDYPSIVLADGWTGEQVRRVIMHELGHAYLGAIRSDFPLWFNEGFAQLFESVELSKHDFSFGRADPESAGLLRGRGLMPMAQIINASHNSGFYNHGSNRGVFYAQSWAFVHMCFMGTDQKLRPALLRYIDTEGGVSDKAAHFEACFGMNLKAAEDVLERYISGGSYRYFEPKFERKERAKVNFVDFKLCEFEAAQYSILSRVHENSEYKEHALGTFRQLEDTDNVLLCEIGSLLSLNWREDQISKSLAERAIALGSKHPRLYINRILEETKSMPHSVSYRMPEEVAKALRERIDQALELYPNNLELITQLTYVEAFAPKLRVSKVNQIQEIAKVVDDKQDLLVLLAYLRWRYKDMRTAKSIFATIKPGEGRYGELSKGMKPYLEKELPWKPYL